METTIVVLVFTTLLLGGVVIYVSRQRNEAVREREEALRTLAALKADSEARLEEIAKARRSLDTHFKGIASEVVETNSEAFLLKANEQFANHAKLSGVDLEKRQQAIQGLIKPVKENLDKLEKHVNTMEAKREGAYTGLQREIGLLRDVTGHLGDALRSSQIRGRWGEQQLRNVLELAGMHEHIDYLEQVTVGSGETRGRPDAVVRVPGGVQVVIDAKTPLEAYLDAHASRDEAKQQELLQLHATTLLGHAKTLGSRDYATSVTGSPSFVVMFVPADPILDVAMGVQPMLWENAWTKHRVLIATPGLLLAFLRTVALAWQERAVQENARKIADSGREMYNRLRTYFGHVEKMGQKLKQAVASYNDSIGSLESRVLPQARRFEKLDPATGGQEIDVPGPIELAVRVPQLPAGDELPANAPGEEES